MSTAAIHLLPFLPTATAAASSIPPLLALSFLVLSLLWFSPGGLPWAVSSFLHPNSPSTPIPGPPGSTPVLSSPLAHRLLAGLASSLPGADRLMAFSVGLTRFVVASHPDTAREILASPAFADRPVKESAYELLFNRAMGFAPHGPYWRTLRRVSAAHMFCPRRIAASGERRGDIGAEMIEEIMGMMRRDGFVEVRRVLHFGSLNGVMMSVFGKRYDFGKGEGAELEGMVREGYELLSLFNWGDYLPLMGWLDLQGVRRRCRSLVSRVDGFVGGIVEEHRMKRRDGGSSNGDFVDVLLGWQLEGEEGGGRLSDSDMVAVLWEMIFRGTDTVAILLEWILARMVLHPSIQSHVQSEIDSAVVDPHRPITDSDVQNLPYLQAVVKETLRMHPPGPLLSWARLATQDAHVDGGRLLVPAGTTAMVNMWAIARDERVWAEPEVFDPERFLREDVSVMGTDMRLAPFGAGRRVCPGKALGLATVQLWLAQLLREFRWVEAGDGGGHVDLSECLRMSMEMKCPLVCRAVPRW